MDKSPASNQYLGQCHCGMVKFEAVFPDGLSSPRSCNCSMCVRRSTVVVPVEAKHFKILKGEGALKKYRFHTKVAEHYFCSNCGIHTHHRGRSNTDTYFVNTGCISTNETISWGAVTKVDGKNHPLDKKSETGCGLVIGVLFVGVTIASVISAFNQV